MIKWFKKKNDAEKWLEKTETYGVFRRGIFEDGRLAIYWSQSGSYGVGIVVNKYVRLHHKGNIVETIFTKNMPEMHQIELAKKWMDDITEKQKMRNLMKKGG